MDPCPAAQRGAALHVRNYTTNAQSQMFELDADYTLRHVPSGLCAKSDGTGGTDVVLDTCDQALSNLPVCQRLHARAQHARVVYL